MTGLHTVALAGFSVRPLAQSAARAGWRVVALDHFGDQDTRAASVAWLPLRSGPAALRQALAQARDRHGAQAWVAGAGFDGRLALLQAGAQALPLLGMAPEANARLRSPESFFTGLAACDVPHPPTRWQGSPARPAGWLRKDMLGSGGWHIRPARSADRPRVGRCWQQHAAGQPMSALFLADGQRARLVGLNRLRVAPLAGRPLVYQGAIGPVPDATLAAAVAQALARLVPHFGLRGLASLDFLAEAGAIQVLEINPRPSATLALHDSAWPQGLLAAHAAALAGELPMPVAAAGCNGEAIAFAPQAVQVDAELAARLAALRCADLPQPGQAIAAGQPLCSVRARADTPDAVEPALRAAIARVHATIAACHEFA